MEPLISKGLIHKIFDTESKSNTFQKREFVIKTEGTYPQFIKFQLVQDRCQLIDVHKEGENVQVHFDLRGNEWNGKYFTNLNVWKIESISESSNAGESPFTEMPTADDELISEDQESIVGDLDDLPF
jgi:hypothetical protein